MNKNKHMTVYKKGERQAQKTLKDQGVIAAEKILAEFPLVSKGLRPTIQILNKATQSPEIIKKLQAVRALQGTDARIMAGIVNTARKHGLTGDWRKVTHSVKYVEKKSTKTPRYDSVETQAQLAFRMSVTLRKRLGKLTNFFDKRPTLTLEKHNPFYSFTGKGK